MFDITEVFQAVLAVEPLTEHIYYVWYMDAPRLEIKAATSTEARIQALALFKIPKSRINYIETMTKQDYLKSMSGCKNLVPPKVKTSRTQECYNEGHAMKNINEIMAAACAAEHITESDAVVVAEATSAESRLGQADAIIKIVNAGTAKVENAIRSARKSFAHVKQQSPKQADAAQEIAPVIEAMENLATQIRKMAATMRTEK